MHDVQPVFAQQKTHQAQFRVADDPHAQQVELALQQDLIWIGRPPRQEAHSHLLGHGAALRDRKRQNTCRSSNTSAG